MGQRTIKQSRSRQRVARKRARHRRRATGWMVGALILAGLVAVFWTTARKPTGGGTVAMGAAAPAFSLPATDGRSVSLASLRGRNVLMYFSEGIGCDPCLTQIVELERHQAHMDRLGITLVPIMVNAAPVVTEEMGRFGLNTPVLIDASKSVSRAYDTLGRGHHAGLPGHSFIAVDKNGVLRWRGDYPGMYVGADEMLGQIEKKL